MFKHRIAAVAFGLLFLLNQAAFAGGSMPVSVSQPPALVTNANAARVQSQVVETGSSLVPEILGAGAIGLYALLKSRKRRIV